MTFLNMQIGKKLQNNFFNIQDKNMWKEYCENIHVKLKFKHFEL